MARQQTDAAKAAKLIRQELKKHKVPAKVSSKTYAGGSSVTVRLADPLPATAQKVEDYTRMFEMGSFDGMTDSYNFDNRREDIPQVKFTFIEREYSPETRQQAWEYTKNFYAGMKNAPKKWEEASRYRVEKMDEYGDILLYRILRGSEGDFWRTKKPKLKVNPKKRKARKVKKTRTAKQKAATRKLVALNKKRAAAKKRKAPKKNPKKLVRKKAATTKNVYLVAARKQKSKGNIYFLAKDGKSLDTDKKNARQYATLAGATNAARKTKGLSAYYVWIYDYPKK